MVIKKTSSFFTRKEVVGRDSPSKKLDWVVERLKGHVYWLQKFMTSCNGFLESISSTFNEQLLRWYFCAKFFKSQTVTREKLCQALSYKKCGRKTLMKLTPERRRRGNAPRKQKSVLMKSQFRQYLYKSVKNEEKPQLKLDYINLHSINCLQFLKLFI